MSLKRRNILAWVLLLLAAVSWTYGQRTLQNIGQEYTHATTAPSSLSGTTAVHRDTAPAYFPTTIHPTAVIERAEGYDYHSTTNVTNSGPADKNGHVVAVESRGERMLGIILCVLGACLAAAGIFGLWQKSPILGPDGAALIGAAEGWVFSAVFEVASLEYFFDYYAIFGIALIFAALLAVRELFGWLLAKCGLSWCTVHRLARRCKLPQLSLLVYVGCIVAALVGLTLILYLRGIYWPPLLFMLAVELFCISCLCEYGADLHHFQQQLDHFQRNLPITVRSGAFSQAETQLLDIQAQHEEAVHAAVTSERFKVELISNVSHDLRTPLTSILGYSELLQAEVLTDVGREQLRRLHLKAGYMNDLVESLFELTKVSSGAAVSKMETLDLIRLLEQTFGLFDDQLSSAGLVVRRLYPSDSVPITTDGARLHQVFANLLGNAIKYALPGTRIYLELKETETHCRIRMINTASYEMDFNPEEITQRFARGDKARSTKGSGLGLAIAQTYTESVGGRFSVMVDGDQFSAIVELPKTERNL